MAIGELRWLNGFFPVTASIAPFATLLTDPVDFHFVGGRQEAKLFGDMFLELLDLRMDKFEDTSTAFTNNVVVMAFFLDVLEARLAVGEMSFLGESTLFHEFHGAVHRRVPHTRVDLPHLVVQFLDADVSIRGEKDLRDILSLRGRFQPLLFDPLPEGLQATAHCAGPPLNSRRKDGESCSVSTFRRVNSSSKISMRSDVG